MDNRELVFVNSIFDNKIAIFCKDQRLKDDLKKIGFTKHLTLEYKNKEDLGKKLMQIRDLNIPFSYGKEWSPVQIIKYLKAENLFYGDFNEITWLNPHHWSIYKIDVGGGEKLISECDLSSNEINKLPTKNSCLKLLFDQLKNFFKR